MDNRLESFSNEELLKAVIENILEHEIGTHDIKLTDEQKVNIIDEVYKRRNTIEDNLTSAVYDELADYRNDNDNDEVDETNYNPYMGQDDISSDCDENYF